MRELTTEDIKKVSLDILKDVADFCDHHRLRYYICGGTLLGAVRHHGYIPWDDDIDILMPRPDYLEFVKTYKSDGSKYIVKSIENCPDYWRTFAKVFDTDTFLQEDAIRLPKKDNGVFIDIFPVDGLPASEFRQKLLFKEQEFLNFLYHGSAWGYTKSYKYADSKDKRANLKGKIRTILKYVAVTLLHPLPTYFLIRLINRNAMRYGYENCEYVAAIVDCHYGGEREKMPRKLFEKQRKFKFETEEFWGSEAWEIYLTNMYGNYMELPPVDKRVTHHDFKAFWKE